MGATSPWKIALKPLIFHSAVSKRVDLRINVSVAVKIALFSS